MEKDVEEKDHQSPSMMHDDDDKGGGDEVGMETATSASPPQFAARPCTVLQHIVRACAGCLLRLCGGGGSGDDGDDPQPGTARREAEALGGISVNRVIARKNLAGSQVLARRGRQPRRPSGPREGRGGSGGSHN
ncbi:hypothetical protein ACP4OV_029338 [Aristida adscensionis]